MELHQHRPNARASQQRDDDSARRSDFDQLAAASPAGNVARFSGFADVYDASRPAPPAALGLLLSRYAGTGAPMVVDLGSGTGLSSRWASAWAGSVVGIEPNDDMRAQAEQAQAASRTTAVQAQVPDHTAVVEEAVAAPTTRAAVTRPAPVDYRPGHGHRTGLPAGCADIVIAVQAFHWMAPEPTLAEISRILQPHGVFAAIDTDWPPAAGIAEAEAAWSALHERFSFLEALLCAGATIDEAREAASAHSSGRDRPAHSGRAEMPPEDTAGEPTENEDDWDVTNPDRVILDGRAWNKNRHLERLATSGHFSFTREIVMHNQIDGGAALMVALMTSQGGYQSLRQAGFSDRDLGFDEFEQAVNDAFALAGTSVLTFGWRARIGVRRPPG